MAEMNLNAPWYTYQKKVKALFEHDNNFIVGDVYKDDTADFAFDIEVRNHEKYLAMEKLFPNTVEFGNVVLQIKLYDEENVNGEEAGIALYETLFNGNPIVKDVKVVVDAAGFKHGFVRFQPRVIQFFNDDTSDYNGNWSGLAQDIAREVFADEYRSIHFCTADLRENGAVNND